MHRPLNLFSLQTCGYATIEDVESNGLSDRMESFFLSETVKYLYLLFDRDNCFNKQYVFTTEGYVSNVLLHMCIPFKGEHLVANDGGLQVSDVS